MLRRSPKRNLPWYRITMSTSCHLERYCSSLILRLYYLVTMIVPNIVPTGDYVFLLFKRSFLLCLLFLLLQITRWYPDQRSFYVLPREWRYIIYSANVHLYSALRGCYCLSNWVLFVWFILPRSFNSLPRNGQDDQNAYSLTHSSKITSLRTGHEWRMDPPMLPAFFASKSILRECEPR